MLLVIVWLRVWLTILSVVLKNDFFLFLSLNPNVWPLVEHISLLDEIYRDAYPSFRPPCTFDVRDLLAIRDVGTVAVSLVADGLVVEDVAAVRALRIYSTTERVHGTPSVSLTCCSSCNRLCSSCRFVIVAIHTTLSTSCWGSRGWSWTARWKYARRQDSHQLRVESSVFRASHAVLRASWGFEDCNVTGLRLLFVHVPNCLRRTASDYLSPDHVVVKSPSSFLFVRTMLVTKGTRWIHRISMSGIVIPCSKGCFRPHDKTVPEGSGENCLVMSSRQVSFRVPLHMWLQRVNWCVPFPDKTCARSHQHKAKITNSVTNTNRLRRESCEVRLVVTKMLHNVSACAFGECLCLTKVVEVHRLAIAKGWRGARLHPFGRWEAYRPFCSNSVLHLIGVKKSKAHCFWASPSR